MTDKNKYLEIEYKYLAGSVTPWVLQEALGQAGISVNEILLYPMTEDYFYSKNGSALDPSLNFVRVRADRFRNSIELTVKGMIDDSLFVRNEVNIHIGNPADRSDFTQKLTDTEAFLNMLGYSHFKTLHKSVVVFVANDSTVIAHYTAYDGTSRMISFIEIEIDSSRGLSYLNTIENKLGKHLNIIEKANRLNDSLLSIFTTKSNEYQGKFISELTIK